jgi:hypothetical protein
LRAALDHGLPEVGLDAAEVVRDLVRDLGPYVTAHASGRFFGFVIGGLHPAAWGAELLVSTWDQNAGLFPPTPGVAVAEELAGQWLVDLLRLPAECSIGFVTQRCRGPFTSSDSANEAPFGSRATSRTACVLMRSSRHCPRSPARRSW